MQTPPGNPAYAGAALVGPVVFVKPTSRSPHLTERNPAPHRGHRPSPPCGSSLNLQVGTILTSIRLRPVKFATLAPSRWTAVAHVNAVRAGRIEGGGRHFPVGNNGRCHHNPRVGSSARESCKVRNGTKVRPGTNEPNCGRELTSAPIQDPRLFPSGRYVLPCIYSRRSKYFLQPKLSDIVWQPNNCC